MLITTRTTKAGRIERRIEVTASDDFGSRTIFASVFEKRFLKTKAACECDVYILERRSSDFGLYVHVKKAGSTANGEEYDVLLNAPGGGHTCDCPHGTYKGHIKPCRHIECALAAARKNIL